MTIEAEIPIRRNGRYTEWINGVPVPRFAPAFTPPDLMSLKLAALSAEYEPVTDEYGTILEGEKRFVGMTCGEVMYIRQALNAARGDLEAVKQLEDRLIGKPKQTIDQNVQVNVTLQDLAKEIQENEAANRYDDTPYTPPAQHPSGLIGMIDVEVVEKAPVKKTIKVPPPIFNPILGL